MKHRVIAAALFFMVVFVQPVSAHPGGTDEDGGHYDGSDYHYHHGYSAHDHVNGVCPYEFDDRTGSSSSTGSGGSSISYNSNSDVARAREQAEEPPVEETDNTTSKPLAISLIACAFISAAAHFICSDPGHYFPLERKKRAPRRERKLSAQDVFEYAAGIACALFLLLMPVVLLLWVGGVSAYILSLLLPYNVTVVLSVLVWVANTVIVVVTYNTVADWQASQAIQLQKQAAQLSQDDKTDT